ncbi:hypothetical protein H7X46_22525 [Pseudonocardia sp. C8]|uniref:hypothetical protein n=1 Tax=Pseudonocardia sp. C8 TaxID=2762759 RepID=UPI00164363EC|nr:hypothetical protein [Pseudonocardia sp. C8]MBC3193841.1 hypothetical protein [Pseudonocardia sp. C8]
MSTNDGTTDAEGRIEMWGIAPHTGAGDRSLIGVAAIGTTAIGPDGVDTLAGVELAIPAEVVSEHGTVRFDVATARAVSAHMIHAADVAEREVNR